jgi:1,4-alpha-glucan branching enzyme
VPIAHYSKYCAGFDDYQALAVEVLQQEAGVPERERAMLEGDARPGHMFTIAAPGAEHVHLAGDFNNWSLDGSEMEPKGDVWTKVVKLPPGRYRYRYVVDGRWQNDPLNAVVEPSPYGGDDSVLVMDERVASTAG